MLDATSVSYYKVVKGTNKVRAMLFVAIVVVVVPSCCCCCWPICLTSFTCRHIPDAPSKARIENRQKCFIKLQPMQSSKVTTHVVVPGRKSEREEQRPQCAL